MPTCRLFPILLLAAAPLAAQTPDTVAEGSYPDIGAAPNGDLHLVYVRGDRLYHRVRSGGRWSAEESTGLSAGLVERSDPEVVVDSQGRPHVLVGSSYARKTDSGWRAIDPGVERDTALAIDSRDNVYVVRRGGHNGGWLGASVLEPGREEFTALEDPDTATGLPIYRNDHVYAHIAVSPLDDSLHVVYRHARPKLFSYRVSHDGGRSWQAGGIADDDREAPSATVAPDGAVYAVSGRGAVYRRDGGPGEWTFLGKAFDAERRDLPVLAADSQRRLYAAAFGGQLNVYQHGRWQGGEGLASLSGKPIGSVDLALAGDDRVFAAWEEGDDLSREERSADGRIVVGEITIGRDVPRFSRFEGTIRNARTYLDPYGDVELNVVYTAPDGSTTEFWGFHDGGDVWRYRFMPDQVGTWRYEATFSDGAPGVAGTFECVESDLPGVVAAAPSNPMWFGYSTGRPLMVRALHVGDAYFAANFPDHDRTAFLDWIAEHRYNTLSIASHMLNRDVPGRGRGWQTPDLWPLNADEYRKMEARLDELEQRRVLVYPFAGFFGKESDYPRDHWDQERYLRYTIARIAPYWNLFFNTAGPEPNLRDTWMDAEDVARLSRRIAELDPFGHIVSVHNRTGDDPYRDSDWTDYGILQGPKTVDQAELSDGLLRNHHPRKPLLAQETLWSGNQFHIRRHGGYSADVLRKNAWVIQMSAAALVFADNEGNSSSGFTGSMHLPDAKERRHAIIGAVWDFMEEIPFTAMKPAQELVDRGYCLADPGRRYLVYLPEGGSVAVKVEGGGYQAEWINARDTSDRRSATFSGAALAAPDGQDWLLSLTR